MRNAVDVFPTAETTARLAGALLGRTGGTNTVETLLAAEADDLRALLGDQRSVTVISL